jgi:hypothetical protein
MDTLVFLSAVSANQNGSAKVVWGLEADAGTNTGRIFAFASLCRPGHAEVFAGEEAVRTSYFQDVEARYHDCSGLRASLALWMSNLASDGHARRV